MKWWVWSQHKSKSSKVLVALSCWTLCNPVGCSPPGSSVHGILQARILERVAIPFSRGSSRHRDRTWVSCIEGFFFFTEWATRKAHIKIKGWYYYFCDHPFVWLSRVLGALPPWSSCWHRPSGKWRLQEGPWGTWRALHSQPPHSWTSAPFPTTPRSCLATSLASVGKHYWLCLYSGVQRSFSV